MTEDKWSEVARERVFPLTAKWIQGEIDGIDFQQSLIDGLAQALREAVEPLEATVDKLKWQVRDTCRRAEKAEKAVEPLEKEITKLQGLFWKYSEEDYAKGRLELRKYKVPELKDCITALKAENTRIIAENLEQGEHINEKLWKLEAELKEAREKDIEDYEKAQTYMASLEAQLKTLQEENERLKKDVSDTLDEQRNERFDFGHKIKSLQARLKRYEEALKKLPHLGSCQFIRTTTIEKCSCPKQALEGGGDERG